MTPLSHWRTVDAILVTAGEPVANFGEIRRNYQEGDPPLLTAVLIAEERGKVVLGRLKFG